VNANCRSRAWRRYAIRTPVAAACCRYLEALEKNVRVEGLPQKEGRAICKGLLFKSCVVARGDHDYRHRTLRCRSVLLNSMPLMPGI